MNKIHDTQSFSSIFASLEKLIIKQLRSFLNQNEFDEHNYTVELPLNGQQSHLGQFVLNNQLSPEEICVILIALVPHIDPIFFDQIIQSNIPKAGDFPQLGGVRGKNSRSFLPTGESCLFILAGDDFEKRMEIQQYFDEDHLFAKKRILWLDSVPAGEPRMSGKIIMSQEFIDLFTTGKVTRPKFGLQFPAQLIETEQAWEDLILNKKTFSQIKELEIWIKHGEYLLNELGMRKKLNPGYRVLFHGPPGTGKTMTAKLLGKYTGKDVYRIDLSMMVSKFIGETEKNLSNLFTKAENKDWILFFDEADALFGKRTNVKDAHDKYANQEVSYLLQRVENYDGLVILATNFKSNIDEAFVRRFQSIIHFPRPDAEERFQIWQRAFPENMQPSPSISLLDMAEKFELSGGEIMNIVHYVCLQTLALEKSEISFETFEEGVRREFDKEGRIMR